MKAVEVKTAEYCTYWKLEAREKKEPKPSLDFESKGQGVWGVYYKKRERKRKMKL